MNNIISYCLFEPNDSMIDRSLHDLSSKEKYRYWSNIPFIYIVNSIYFNDFKTRIYVHSDVKNHPLYSILDELTKFDNFELEFMDKDQKGTSPATWRVKSIWDIDSNICFCRDLDSVMSPREAKCMHYFINSEFWINNIRGLCGHNDHGAMLMAGLSGFKSRILRKELSLSNNFDDYINFCEKNHGTAWASDQYALINFFIKSRQPHIISKVLDFYTQPYFNRLNEFYCENDARNLLKKVVNIRYPYLTSIDETHSNNINLNYIDNKILNLTDSITVWMGQPVDVRGVKLNELLSIENNYCEKVKNILLNSNILKEFYSI